MQICQYFQMVSCNLTLSWWYTVWDGNSVFPYSPFPLWGCLRNRSITVTGYLPTHPLYLPLLLTTALCMNIYEPPRPAYCPPALSPLTGPGFYEFSGQAGKLLLISVGISYHPHINHKNIAELDQHPQYKHPVPHPPPITVTCLHGKASGIRSFCFFSFFSPSPGDLSPLTIY